MHEQTLNYMFDMCLLKSWTTRWTTLFHQI